MHSVVNGYMCYISSQKVSYMLSYVVIVYLTDICKVPQQTFIYLISQRCFPNNFFSFNVSYEECDPGYYWINCSKTCEYPYFGQQCEQSCSCEKHLCNVMIGCENSE